MKTLVATPAELAAAREARGMSQVDISHRIKLQIRQVNALEQGQWETLPGRAFVRGALRSYGRLLEVDVAPLLETIGGFAEPAAVLAMQPLESSFSRSSAFDRGSPGSRVLWVLVCLVGVVALVVYFGSDPDSERLRSWLPSGDTASREMPDPVASSTDPAGVSPPAPRATDPSAAGSLPSPAPTTPSTSAANAPAAPSPAGTVPAGTVPTGTVPGGTVPGGASLDGTSVTLNSAGGGASDTAPGGDSRKVMQFRALDDSWIEVRQADGSALHNALLKAGTSLELKGNPPYRLVLGNANRLELSYEGRTQDLAAHIRAHNIAKLQLQ